MELKHLNRIIAILIAALFTTMCSKHDSLSINEDEAIKMEVSFLTGCDTIQSPTARLVINLLDFSLIEIYDPNNKDILSYHYMDSYTGQSLMIMVSTENIVITEFDPISGKKGDTALVSSIRNGLNRLDLCKVDWRKETFDIEMSVALEESSPELKTKADEFDEEIRETLVKHFSTFSEKISDLGNEISFLGPIANGATIVCDIYTYYAIPTIQASLHENEPAKQEEIINKAAISYVMDFITDRIYIKGLTIPMSLSQVLFILKKTSNILPDLEWTLSKNYEEYEEGEESVQYYMFTSNKCITSSINTIVQELPDDDTFTLTVSVSNITETSADVSGSYNLSVGSGGYYIDMGICYYPEGSSSKQYISSTDLKTVTINGLTEATSYEATTYIKTLATTYSSLAASFTTKGIRFNTSKSELSFDAKGGTEHIDITIGDKSTWEVTAAPKWCTTKVDKNSLTVSVKDSDKEREGEIVLTCTNMYGESENHLIGINQNQIGWDGTSWTFNGEISFTSGSGRDSYTETFPLENMQLNIIDVAQNDFRLIMEGDEDYINEIYLDNDKNLILKQSMNGKYNGVKVNGAIVYTFTRTGESTASGVISGKMTVDEMGGMSTKYSGHLIGKRTN